MSRNKNQEPQIDNGTERRFAPSSFEIRATEGKPDKLRGYALRFGSVYDMGWYTEEVSREAFARANMDDIRILLNHDPNIILGRTAAGTATVGIDENGLWYEADLPNSPNGQNAREAIGRGDITQSSWGFRMRRDDTGRDIGSKWSKRNGVEHRVIADVAEVLDASPVTYPANPDTTVAKRSLEAASKEETETPDYSGTYDKLNRTYALAVQYSQQT